MATSTGATVQFFLHFMLRGLTHSYSNVASIAAHGSLTHSMNVIAALTTSFVFNHIELTDALELQGVIYLAQGGGGSHKLVTPYLKVAPS